MKVKQILTICLLVICTINCIFAGLSGNLIGFAGWLVATWGWANVYLNEV